MLTSVARGLDGSLQANDVKAKNIGNYRRQYFVLFGDGLNHCGVSNRMSG